MKRNYLARVSLAHKLKELAPQDLSAHYVQQVRRLTDEDLAETERKVLFPMRATGASPRTGARALDPSYRGSPLGSVQGSPSCKLKAKAEGLMKPNRKALKMVNLDELSKSQCNALKSTRFQNRSRSTLATTHGDGKGFAMTAPMSPTHQSRLQASRDTGSPLMSSDQPSQAPPQPAGRNKLYQSIQVHESGMSPMKGAGPETRGEFGVTFGQMPRY